ncbi:TPA: type II secretion system protein, partial [Candidatus Galligastranaerophilus faecipullorum]|nr:type II secretion system protein [Candidatus Galligastranaerophilus faecipullorum]
MQKRDTNGFTLAELLTAVLVISIIMVALAPVITKRMKDTMSVQTDNKKGLEVYTNPGTYTFDVPIGINTLFLQGSGGGGGGAGSTYVEKTVNFTSSATWTVPTGVNQITFTAIGSGGGGGGANGKEETDNCKLAKDKKTNLNFSYPVKEVIRGNSDERDICVIAENMINTNEGVMLTAGNNKNAGETCASGTNSCCWITTGASKCSSPVNSHTCYTEVNVDGVLHSGKDAPVCTRMAANNICQWVGTGGNATIQSSYLLFSDKVAQKMIDGDFEYYAKLLNFTTYCSTSAVAANNCAKFVPLSGVTSKCKNQGGSAQCRPGYYHLRDDENSPTLVLATYSATSREVMNMSSGVSEANSVRCYKVLNRMTRYSGSGGSSGAVLEKTINVLPNDTFE